MSIISMIKYRSAICLGEKRDAVRYAHRRIEALRDRFESPGAARAEEAGVGAARGTHRLVAGPLIQDRAWSIVSDAADAAAHRDGVQRRPRSFLHRERRATLGSDQPKKGS